MAPCPTGKTKIVCTLGPSSCSVETLVRLLEAGMDVVRLNFSHGTLEGQKQTLANVHEAMRRTGRTVGILQDLQGPKIRIGALREPFVELVAGREVVITTDETPGTAERISTSFSNLVQDVTPGEPILLDDGKLRLTVLEVRGHDVRCRIDVGGKLSAHKGINLPGIPVSAPSYTEKDLQDLAFGLENDVDYVALSFVRTADDLRNLRREI